jgi:hypothetical protein
MQALPRNESWCIIRRQAVHLTAEESTRLRMVANIPAQSIPIIETAITGTGGLPTATAFTSRSEDDSVGCPCRWQMLISHFSKKEMFSAAHRAWRFSASDSLI